MTKKHGKSMFISIIIAVILSIGFLVVRNTLALDNGQIYTRDQLSEIVNDQRQSIDDYDSNLNDVLNSKLITMYLNNSVVSELPNSEQLYLDYYQCDGTEEIVFNLDTNKLSMNNFSTNSNCSVYLYEGTTLSYNSSTPYEEYIVPQAGIYKIELWGSKGGSNSFNIPGANGSYVSGEIELEANTHLYFVLGSKSGYNGGGTAGTPGFVNNIGGFGGGATDVRTTINADVLNSSSLASRIMVAAGGGGAGGSTGDNATHQVNSRPTGVGHAGNGGSSRINEGSYPTGGLGGGSYSGFGYYSGGDVTSYVKQYGDSGTNGSFGKGGNGGITAVYKYNMTSYYSGFSGGSGAGGGGGYFGGGGGAGSSGWWGIPGGSGGGGSSYISGHTGSIAIESLSSLTEKSGCTEGTTNNACSIHPSGIHFDSTTTKILDGRGYSWTGTKNLQEQMPNPNGGRYSLGTGHNDNGYARITFLRN